jgi:4-oxalocrotonate tautomerase
MPTLQLKLSPQVTPAVEAALAQELTRLSAECLGKRPEVTALMIEALPAARWFIGAQAEPGPTAWMEISITAGTNTPAQKADFIAAAYAALQRHLGLERPLAQASYVIVRELPAGDWGYGGQTQAARQQARRVTVEPAQAK